MDILLTISLQFDVSVCLISWHYLFYVILFPRVLQRNFPFKKKMWYLLRETYFRSIIYSIVLANCQSERNHALFHPRKEEDVHGQLLFYDLWLGKNPFDCPYEPHHHPHQNRCTHTQWITCHMSFSLTIIYKLNDFLTDCLLFEFCMPEIKWR